KRSVEQAARHRGRASCSERLKLVFGEVDLAGVLLGLADDLEAAHRQHAAAALHGHHDALVDAEVLAVEGDVADDAALTAARQVLLERADELLLAARDVPELDGDLEIVERLAEEGGVVDLPRLLLL